MSARVPLLDVADAADLAAKQSIPAAVAELNFFRALLHHPALAGRVSDLLMTILLGGRLEARLRELVIMRLGWATGSAYEWTQHWRIALQLGISQEDLLDVRDWRASDRLSEADRAVLAATDETLSTGTISAQTWEHCRSHVGSDAEMLELVVAIGTWRMISSVLRSVDIPLEEGVPAWPPDGRRPLGAGTADD